MQGGAAFVLRDEAVLEDVLDGDQLTEGAADDVGGLVGSQFLGGGDEREGGGAGRDFEIADALFVDVKHGLLGAVLELDGDESVAEGFAGFAVEHVDGDDGRVGWGGGLGWGLGEDGRAEQ